MHSPRSLIVRVAMEGTWPGIAVIVLHGLLGELFGHEPYVDPIMHVSGGVAAAYFFWRAGIILTPMLGAPSRLALDLLAFGLTCAVALFWEFAEYLVDTRFGTRMQRGLTNTMRDLVLAVIGSVLYIAMNRMFSRSSRVRNR